MIRSLSIIAVLVLGALTGLPALAQTGFARVSNNTALSALPTTAFAFVVREGFATAGDGPATTYTPGATACSLNAGSGDGGSQVPSSDGKCWIAAILAGAADARVWGVAGYYTSAAATAGPDQVARLQSCIAAATKCQLPGVANGGSIFYRAAETLNVPEGHELAGVGFAPGGPPIGATIVCDLSVSPCIIAGQASAPSGNLPRGSGTLRDLIQFRAAGTIPANSVGIQENYAQDGLAENIVALRDDICLDLESNISLGSGTEIQLDHVWTASCQTTHVKINGWASAFFHGLTMGIEGYDTTTSSTNYFLITGGRAADVNAGPNTIVVDQFIAVAPSVTNFVNFANCNICTSAGNNTSPVIYKWAQGHAEGVTHILATDSSVSFLEDVSFSDDAFFCNGDFFAVNAATQIESWRITNNHLLCAGTLAPTPTILGLVLRDNWLGGSWSITGASGSQVDAGGNIINPGVGSVFVNGGPYTNPAPGTPMQVPSLATGSKSSIAESNYNGMISISSIGVDPDSAVFLVGNGSVVLLTSTGGTWVAGCSPASGKQSIGYNCRSTSQYDIYNNQGNTLIYHWMPAGVSRSLVQ